MDLWVWWKIKIILVDSRSLTFRTKQLYANFCWNLIHREWRAAEVLRDDPMTTKNMNETSATLRAEAHRESARWNAFTLLIALSKIIGGTSHIIQLYFFLFKITFSSMRLCIDHTTFIYIYCKKKKHLSPVDWHFMFTCFMQISLITWWTEASISKYSNRFMS